MKGKQLTLQEVLDLEDGTKVWVGRINKKLKEHIISGDYIEEVKDSRYAYHKSELEGYKYFENYLELEFYEDDY